MSCNLVTEVSTLFTIIGGGIRRLAIAICFYRSSKTLAATNLKVTAAWKHVWHRWMVRQDAW